jgi:signal transduction histidine kinase/CheY-like chemotaxis protein
MSSLAHRFLDELGYVLLEHRGNGVFALCSPAPAWFTELWGVSPDEHGGIPLAQKSAYLESFLYEADAFWISHGMGSCQSELWIEKTPAGREIPLQAMALLLDEKRYLALHSPELQFQERTQILQTARNSLLVHEKLLREIQKKEILLHCIIHDLSQPLSVMSISLDLLSREEISARGKRFLDLGKIAGDQQQAMIRDILRAFAADLKTNLEAEGTTDAAPDLLAAAKEVMAGLSPTFEAKGVELALKAPDDLLADWHVHAEDSRLRRVFSNLLENALRYTPPRYSVTVGIEDDGDFRTAYIDDEGPGLPQDLRPEEIFGLFAMGKENAGKAGLGLYFCRITVERWGGTIGCATRADKGARFWFRLPKAGTPVKPAAPKNEQQKVPAQKKVALPGKKSLRILFADDQEEIRTLTGIQLERAGHLVVTVSNGQEALEALGRGRFDFVLMDEEMPVMSGMKAAQAIRQNEKDGAARSFLVALTGNNTDDDRDRLLAAGFDWVIGKPFRMDTLEKLFADPNSVIHGPVVPEKLNEMEFSSAESLLHRVGGDEDLLRKMIRTFLRDTPKRMAEIQKALREKDAENLASVAHALKGSVNIFGAVAAGQHAQELQGLGRQGQLDSAPRVYELLKEEIARLEVNLRGYAVRRASPASGTARKPERQDKKSHRKHR